MVTTRPILLLLHSTCFWIFNDHHTLLLSCILQFSVLKLQLFLFCRLFCLWLSPKTSDYSSTATSWHLCWVSDKWCSSLTLYIPTTWYTTWCTTWCTTWLLQVGDCVINILLGAGYKTIEEPSGQVYASLSSIRSLVFGLLVTHVI